MARVWTIIATGWLLAFPLTGSAATYHVDPNGADANPGTAQMPWRTLQHAALTMVAGDTAIVGPGLYDEQVFVTVSGTDAAPITFQGSTGAILESPNPAASMSAFDVQPGVGYVVIDGFEVRGGFHESIYVRGAAHHITVRNCDIHHNRVGIWLADANNVEVDGCSIHDNTIVGLRVDGASHDVLVRDTSSYDNDDGFGCSGDADGFVVEEDAFDVTFSGCMAYGNGEDGFDLQGDRVLVARSRSQDNPCVGIKTGQNARVENAVVTGNTTGIATTSLYNQSIDVEVINSIVADNSGNQIRFGKPNAATSPVEYGALVRNTVIRSAGKAIEAEPYVSLTEDHNVLFREDSFSRLIVHHIGAAEEFFTGAQINAGEWTASSGQGVGTFAVDPDFGAEYLLDPASTAIDGGSADQAPSDDFYGAVRPQGNATDAGPYESAEALGNHRPWADPGPDRWGVAGFSLSFNAYGSVDPDGDALSYSWDFGDGGALGTGYGVSHQWAQAGHYTLTLTAADGELDRSRTALVSISPAPTSTPTSTPTATPTPTRTATFTPTRTPNLTRDSVVLPLRPVKVKIRSGTAAAVKGLRVKVYNGDPRIAGDDGHVIRMTAETVTCPLDAVATPDLDARQPGAQETKLLAPGRGARASVNLTLSAADFTTLNRKTPQRCLIRLAVTAEVAGNTDPTPQNNEVLVAIDVYDFNDVEQPAPVETVIDSVKPLTMKLARGATSATRAVAFRVGSGDVVPQRAVPGHTIEVVASDGDCPPGTVTGVDMDRSTSGLQSGVVLAGGRRATGTLLVSAAAADFSSAGRRSPGRCTAQIRAAGTGNDGDPSNDTAVLSIDVVDLNDF